MEDNSPIVSAPDSDSPTVEVPPITKEQIVAAVTNAPELSPDEFQLGDGTFKVVFLPYNDYVTFLGYLQPFLSTLIVKKAVTEKVSIPGIDLGISADANTLITFCIRSLPEMVRLIAKQTVPDITVEEIKLRAQNPFVLAGIVMQQIAKNNMIRDFALFFRQVTPLLKVLK